MEAEPMRNRKLSLVFSFLATAVLATLALNYVSSRVGERRILVQESWLSSSEESAAYQSYGEAGSR
jgi:hypothetical protein